METRIESARLRGSDVDFNSAGEQVAVLAEEISERSDNTLGVVHEKEEEIAGPTGLPVTEPSASQDLGDNVELF